jgi:HEPN domain-containing protein
MANKESAAQWLVKAYHDLSSAQVLYDADHYTDTIGYDVQQALEKALKSFLAHGNEPVRKTHDLVELSKLVEHHIHFESAEIDLLDIATTYYTQDRYPGPVAQPPREQVKEILDFAKTVFTNVCQSLEINEDQIK